MISLRSSPAREKRSAASGVMVKIPPAFFESVIPNKPAPLDPLLLNLGQYWNRAYVIPCAVALS